MQKVLTKNIAEWIHVLEKRIDTYLDHLISAKWNFNVVVKKAWFSLLSKRLIVRTHDGGKGPVKAYVIT